METLPKNWAILITESNESVLYEYWKKLPGLDRDYTFKGWLVPDKTYDNSYMRWTIYCPEGYTEITFEDFKRLELKQNQEVGSTYPIY